MMSTNGEFDARRDTALTEGPGKGDRQLANPALQVLEAIGDWQGSNQPQTTPKTGDFGPKSGIFRQ